MAAVARVPPRLGAPPQQESPPESARRTRERRGARAEPATAQRSMGLLLMTAKRGQCSACRFRHPLRKDGTMQAHPVYCGNKRRECEGGGQPPVPFDPNLCGACLEHQFSTPGLVEACFSVAIESRKTGEALMWDYLIAYHESGHTEVA